MSAFFGDWAIACEVADGLAGREADLDGIDLDDLAGPFGLELARQAHGIDAFVLTGRVFRAFAQVWHCVTTPRSTSF